MVCLYVCMLCVCVCVCVCACACMCVCVCVYIYVCVCVCGLYKKKCKYYIIFNNLSTFKDEHFKLTGDLDWHVPYQ